MNLNQFTQAVFITDNQIKTDSLKIAKIFGKLHKNVLRAIENLKSECEPDYYQLNFEPVIIKYENGKGGIQQAPAYNLTKDGFTLLAMGFTGKQALQFKVAFIQAFNHMADILSQQQNQLQHLQTGTVVQLRSGSVDLTVQSIDGNNAEIIWFKNGKIHRENLPTACLTYADHGYVAPAVQNTIEQFWQMLFNHGINQYNHSNRTDQIALNLTQLFQQFPNLPKRSELLQILPQSKAPYPEFIGQNISVLSRLHRKSIRCWTFKTTHPTLLDVTQDQ